MSEEIDLTNVPVAAPMNTDSAGSGGVVASQSVLRILCAAESRVGTGFLHKSGKIITAAHVTRGCSKIELVLPNNVTVIANTISFDTDRDLALLEPSQKITARSLDISSSDTFSIGTQVSTWGFPAGYNGIAPLLSVGYLAGRQPIRRTGSGAIISQWVVNAAFNGGNSGGPLLQIETGDVIGVVSSKLAPISPAAQSILTALEGQSSGFVYTATLPDGTTKSFSEGQLVGMVLNELRMQVQLVIGNAVLLEDLKNFLKSNNIDP